MEIREFESRIGYRFKDMQLLEMALCHSSLCGESSKAFDRMEYLGDAVIELTVSAYLYNTFPDYEEGTLTKVRTGIVSEGALSKAAKRVGIDALIKLGKGEELTNGRRKPSILSDAFEAVAAAVFLDGGFSAASDFVIFCLKEIIRNSIEQGGVLDYKTRLQEEIQRSSLMPVEYKTVSSSDKNYTFYSEAFHDGTLLGKGYGNRKKEAEQQAAKFALQSKQPKA